MQNQPEPLRHEDRQCLAMEEPPAEDSHQQQMASSQKSFFVPTASDVLVLALIGAGSIAVAFNVLLASKARVEDIAALPGFCVIITAVGCVAAKVVGAVRKRQSDRRLKPRWVALFVWAVGHGVGLLVLSLLFLVAPTLSLVMLAAFGILSPIIGATAADPVQH